MSSLQRKPSPESDRVRDEDGGVSVGLDSEHSGRDVGVLRSGIDASLDIKSSVPKSRSTVSAQDIQKQRNRMQKEVHVLVLESVSLNRQLEHTLESIEFIKRGYSGLRGKRQSGDRQSGPDDAQDSGSTAFTKKRKLEEDDPQEMEEVHKSAEVKGAAKAAIKTPLMQRLLMGTLQRSQKELERDKSDKSVRHCDCLFSPTQLDPIHFVELPRSLSISLSESLSLSLPCMPVLTINVETCLLVGNSTSLRSTRSEKQRKSSLQTPNAFATSK